VSVLGLGMAREDGKVIEKAAQSYKKFMKFAEINLKFPLRFSRL
jgi:hypothetical protein